MAVKLYLNNQEVITDSSQEIRITRENPYFTLSDSYTLDITIPLSILQNRKFFGDIQRIEKKKEYQEYSCKLYCANSLLMEGTARIIQSSVESVKVQLACGVSALKMSSEQEGTYIDSLITEKEGDASILISSLDYGAMVGANHLGWGVPVLDNTNDTVINLGTMDYAICRGFPHTSECPRLLDIASLVAAKMGYTIDMSFLPAACSNIYVISATHGNLGKKVPHWTVKEFFKQLQNFFGCTLIRTGTGNKNLKFVPVDSFAQNPVTTISPLTEYQVDYSEEDDAEGIMNRNVEFEMEESGDEIVDEEILEQAKYTSEYGTLDAMTRAFQGESDDVRMHKIYKLNGEKYVGWENEDGSYNLKRIAPFNPLIRFDDAESVKLKIAPVHMEEDVECSIWYIYDILGGQEMHSFKINVPSISNPFGLSMNWVYGGTGNTGEDDGPTMQSLVEGTESIVDNDEKADIMSVAFIEDKSETVTTHNEKDYRQANFPIHLAFTDYNFKRQLSNNRSRWSFSLTPLTGYDFYLGQLHRLSFRCSHRVKHIFKFMSDAIPEADNVFIIRGKRFACEKIEASIKDGNLDKLMTGYFYEMS